MSIKTVSIIGAGLSGLSLGLFLKKQGIDITIYELRGTDVASEGAVMLSPNALRTLDALGVYTRIQNKGYQFRDLHFNTNDHKTMDKYEMGNSQKYGYDALRVYRQVLLDELKAMAEESGIPIFHDKKLSHVVSEDIDNGITVAFTDGTQATSDVVIGADGIHSTVRRYLYPQLKPTFSNFMAINCAIPTEKIQIPFENYPLPVGIHGSAGAFVMAPQNPDGSEVLAGIQYQTHDRDRAGWDALWQDKEGLLRMVKEKYGEWNEMVRSAMDAIPLRTLGIWAFYTVPKLEAWSSKAARVVLIGDSAHAIPPAAGQGVNQAFEDVHAFALLLAAVNQGKMGWEESLKWWQDYRQERIDRVGALTAEMNKRRMPGWTGEGAETIDSEWLFSVDIEGDVGARVEKFSLSKPV